MLKRKDDFTSRVSVCATVVIVCGLFGAGSAMAVGFGVKPVHVQLYPGHMTESIEVHNDESVPLSLQIRAYAWNQDGEGQDLFEATDELVFFPKLLVLNPDESRMVRIGVRGIPLEKEKAYRIYLEELPDGSAVQEGHLRTLLRVGIPVFRLPGQPEYAGEVTNVAIDGCEAQFLFTNHGNVHYKLKTVAVRALDGSGIELASDQLKGWYVLTGREKQFSYTIPEKFCKATERFEVRIESERQLFEGFADNRL